MQHFNRERVPERVVHAKGTGVHGARVAAGLGKATSENGAAAQAAEVVAARANRA